MSATLKPTCCQQIFGSRAFNRHTCGKAAKFERDGKHYCGIHDPVAKKAKDDAKYAIWKTKQDAKEKERADIRAAHSELVRRAGCFDELLEALGEIVAAADGDGWKQIDAGFSKARAAIAKAKGEQA